MYIYVEDSGPGIPLSERDHLFCKSQLSLDSLSQGTGVGLSLCKSLVDLMGGELWPDESYISGFNGNPGSRFIIDLIIAPVTMDSFISLQTETTALDTIGSLGDVVGDSLHSPRELPEHSHVSALCG